MAHHPYILAVTRRHTRKNKYVQFLGEYHLDLLLRYNAIPIMVPAIKEAIPHLENYRKLMDGVLIVEGEDIDPHHYQDADKNIEWIEEIDKTKDIIEFSLINYALEHQVPYLGICKGSHLLNVASGGTLYTDVMKEKGTDLRHIDYDNYDGYRHVIRIEPNTPLYEWVGQSSLPVTTYHHQGIKRLADRFTPMAHTDDGLIEGFYDPNHPFCMGLQFHPERMLSEHPGMVKAHEAFVSAATHYATLK